MSDIFLSCATDDRMTALEVAGVFRQQGWTVWWDASTLSPGADYLDAVAEELWHSKVVVLLWSDAAQKSRLVREMLGRVKEISVVVVLLEKVELPIQLSILPHFDLTDWEGAASHRGLQRLLLHLRALISVSSYMAKLRTTAAAPTRPEFGDELRMPKQDAPPPPEARRRFKGIFISYRRDEAKAHAKWLYDRLAAHFGREKVFLDLENVGLGKNFVKVITSAAESCAVMVALIGRQWLRSADGQSGFDDFVRLEVATALRREIDVIPIILPGASMPLAKDLPEDLSSFAHNNALPLSENRWERDVEDLIKSLEGLLQG